MTENAQNNQTLQQAASDIAMIRRVIVDGKPEDPLLSQKFTSIGANTVLQACGFILAGLGICYELSTGHQGSRDMLDSAGIPSLQIAGLIQIALMLTVLCGALYFFVHRAAKRSNKNFDQYVSRNFSYLKNLSFISDVLVKFTIIAILILAEKPELVAPVFMLFIGDYLIQGRFFTIPLVASLTSGLLCIIGAAAMFYFNISLLVIPMAAFGLVSLLSLGQMISLRKKASEQPAV